MMSKLSRIRELIDLVQNKDDFFINFDKDYSQLPGMKEHYDIYSEALDTLDEQSWAILRNKAIDHYSDHKKGQLKQGFFNHLNEAFAYKYLQSCGYQEIRFIPEERKRRTPDIKFRDGKQDHFCEVKTAGISEDEIIRRREPIVTDYTTYSSLSDGFLNKFFSNIQNAKNQIQEYCGEARGIAFIITIFDDFTREYHDTYEQQLTNLIDQHQLGQVQFLKTLYPAAIIRFL